MTLMFDLIHMRQSWSLVYSVHGLSVVPRLMHLSLRINLLPCILTTSGRKNATLLSQVRDIGFSIWPATKRVSPVKTEPCHRKPRLWTKWNVKLTVVGSISSSKKGCFIWQKVTRPLIWQEERLVAACLHWSIWTIKAKEAIEAREADAGAPPSPCQARCKSSRWSRVCGQACVGPIPPGDGMLSMKRRAARSTI